MELCYWQGHNTGLDVTIFEVAGGAYPEHTHHGFHELMLVASGTIRHRHCGVVRNLPQRSLLLIREKDSHELLGGGGTALNLPFTIDWFDKTEQMLDSPGWTRCLLKGKPPTAMIPESDWDSVKGKFEALLQNAQGMKFRPMFASLLLELLTCYLRGEEESENNIPDACPAWMKLLVREMNHNQEKEWTAREMAHHAGCSTAHLSRTFRKHYDLTPVEYLNKLRLHRASRLLLHTNRRVKEIAALIGFSSQSYFCRLFYKQYGIQPGAYREKHQGMPLK